MNSRNFAKMIVKRGIKDDEHDEKTRDNIVNLLHLTGQ
jgi:hypothetical protein